MDIGSQNNSVVRFSSVKASSQGSLSGTVHVSGKQVVRTEWEYEYWLVADSQTMKAAIFFNIGHHVFNALIGRETITYSNGEKETKNWKPVSTFGVWPEQNQFDANQPWKIVDGGIKKNTEDEVDVIKNILAGSLNGIYAVRKVKVSESLMKTITDNAGKSGCSATKYSVAGLGINCSCATFATRMWHVVTGEDFRPYGLFERDPLSIFNAINQFNYRSNNQFAYKNNISESLFLK